jgi:bisphosphoglycerate-independent phosphoglycerate mutase (AlkP superfamily)
MLLSYGVYVSQGMTCVLIIPDGWACRSYGEKTAYFLAQWNVLLQGTKNEILRMEVISLEALAHDLPLLLWPDPG